jgi:hypothetical protein
MSRAQGCFTPHRRECYRGVTSFPSEIMVRAVLVRCLVGVLMIAGVACSEPDTTPPDSDASDASVTPDADVDAADSVDAAATDADTEPSDAPLLADVDAVPACVAEGTGTWIVTRFEFLGANPDGTVEGFDIDGRVSNATDDEGCNQFDGTSADGVRGIDNQLSSLLPALEATGVSLDVLIGARIREGTLLLVAERDGTAETCVAMRFQRGDGDPLYGTDGTFVPYQTLDRYEGATVSTTTSCAWTSPCELALSGELLTLEFLFLTQEIQIELAAWQGRLTLRDDGSFEGLIGGAVALDSVMAIVAGLGGCGDDPIREVLEPLLPRFADVFPDASGDCTGLSATVRVEAVPIYLFED